MIWLGHKRSQKRPEVERKLECAATHVIAWPIGIATAYFLALALMPFRSFKDDYLCIGSIVPGVYAIMASVIFASRFCARISIQLATRNRALVTCLAMALLIDVGIFGWILIATNSDLLFHIHGQLVRSFWG